MGRKTKQNNYGYFKNKNNLLKSVLLGYITQQKADEIASSRDHNSSTSYAHATATSKASGGNSTRSSNHQNPLTKRNEGECKNGKCMS